MATGGSALLWQNKTRYKNRLQYSIPVRIDTVNSEIFPQKFGGDRPIFECFCQEYRQDPTDVRGDLSRDTEGF